MSTAVDTALEELFLEEAPAPVHFTCDYCYPTPAVGDVALCGHRCSGPEAKETRGVPVCAKCAAVDAVSPLPCGHP